MCEKRPKKSGEKNEPFKACPLCGVTWSTMFELLADPQIRLHGYQVDFEDLLQGIFLFNHLECNTTISIKVWRFQGIHHGPVYAEQKNGSQQCPEYCLKPDLLVPCPSECACAFIRDLMQMIREWSVGGA